jgi:hypothetical protein
MTNFTKTQNVGNKSEKWQKGRKSQYTVNKNESQGASSKTRTVEAKAANMQLARAEQFSANSKSRQNSIENKFKLLFQEQTDPNINSSTSQSHSAI